MPDAGDGVVCGPACQRVERGTARVKEDAARPGSIRGESTPGSCCYAGNEEDAARPGFATSGLRSCGDVEAASLRRFADRRVVKLRPVPQEPCRRREEPVSVQGALRPGCPRGRSERRSNRCECVLRGGHRESEAQSFRSDPWAAVRRARLDPMQPVPDSGDGNPPGF